MSSITSLDFLYLALGGGFILLVIFLCVVLLNLAVILRDVIKITDNAKVISEKIRETVLEPFKAVSEMTAMFGDLLANIRHKFEEHMEAEQESEEEGKPHKKGLFKVKKMKK